MPPINKDAVILITGASQGIGFELAQQFQKVGYRVVGVARTLLNQQYLFDAQIMDVTNEEAIKKTITYIQKKYGRLDVLINNAGYGIAGPIEETPLTAIKQLYDVNVFGMHQVTQASLPLLKKTTGLIINIGSVAGDFTIPFQTFYSMTKSSVASYSEGLRLELKPFGVRVVNVKPGDTKSNFSKQRQKFTTPSSAYQARTSRSLAVMEKDEKNGLPSISVFSICNRLIHQKNPAPQVTVGSQYRIMQALKKVLPNRLVLWLVYQIYGK
jgi:short-subunit dehydrogenase